MTIGKITATLTADPPAVGVLTLDEARPRCQYRDETLGHPVRPCLRNSSIAHIRDDRPLKIRAYCYEHGHSPPANWLAAPLPRASTVQRLLIARRVVDKLTDGPDIAAGFATAHEMTSIAIDRAIADQVIADPANDYDAAMKIAWQHYHISMRQKEAEPHASP